MDKLIFNKEKFMATDFGKLLTECVKQWDEALEACGTQWSKALYAEAKADAKRCEVQWAVYQLAMQEFYGMDLHFTRTDDYFGVCTEDESFWLFKIDRT